MTPTPDELTPRQRFLADATKRAHLYTLLRDPVLEEAMDLAEDEMRPRTNTVADSNQAIAIAKFHQSAGVSAYRADLKELTKEKREVVKPSVQKMARTLDDLPPSAR
jgi:hypothetical protein